MPAIDAEKLRAIRERVLGALGSTRADRAAQFFTLVLVAFGLSFRARGFLFGVSPFWLDECSWAVFLFDQRYADDSIRPLGFMAVSRFVAHQVSAAESALRFMPWLAGVTMTLLSPFLARRLYAERAARLLFVAIIALHPSAIDFSKEFKPYSMSLALHGGLLLLTLRYMADGGLTRLLAPLLVAVLGNLFAQDLVFAYPGIFLALVWHTRSRSRSELALVLSTAAVIVATLGLQYWLVWSRLPQDSSTYWGEKYNVFHTGADGQSYAAWVLERLRDVLGYPGYRRELWRARALSPESLVVLRRIDTILWALVALVGIAVLSVRRRIELLILLALPLVALWLFNGLDLWPLGAFRTNHFALVYTGALAAFVLDRPFSLWKRHALAPLVPALALVVLPIFLFYNGLHRIKRGQAHEGFLPSALSKLGGHRLREVSPVKELLLVGTRGCPQWEYYSRLHPRAQEITGVVQQVFHVRCKADEELRRAVHRAVRPGTRVWVLLQGDLTAEVLAQGPPGDHLDIVHSFSVGWLRVAALAKPGYHPPPLLKALPRR